MNNLPGFPSAIVSFVQDEAYKEGTNILAEKDSQRKDFDMNSLRTFSYEDQLAKLQRTNPILVAAIMGSIKKTKIKTYDDLNRKGFGGNNRDLDIDLTPAIVQTASRVIRNCHPSSVSIMASMNSLFLWTCRASGHVFQFFNALGDCYRYVFNKND